VDDDDPDGDHSKHLAAGILVTDLYSAIEPAIGVIIA